VTIFSPTRDKNEPAIIKALVAVGCTVTRLHEPGVPDLLVGYHGETFLLEVKGSLGKKGGSSSVSLTPTQEKWWSAWAGARPVIVRSVEEALAAIGVGIKQPGLYIDCPEHGPRCRGENCCCADKHKPATYPRAR
jgi:hypothetical protein